MTTTIDDELWAALGEPTRRRLLDLLLAGGSGTATSLSAQMPVTRQAVAKHLATLADAGLVESERQVRETRYRLTEAGEDWDERLDALRRHLGRSA